MDQTKQAELAKQFSRDDGARIAASTINAVLEALRIQQIVEGIAVLPAGEGGYLVDALIRDLVTKRVWGIVITIPPAKEQTNGLD